VVSFLLRKRYMDRVAMLHSSPEKMVWCIWKSMWWPHMSADIRELRNQCHTCVECSPLQKPEPLQPHEPASYPFQAIHMDLCSYMKKQYLVIADQF
jgi:hypothetical protein